MSDDAIECRVRYYVNVPRRTHRLVCNGKIIGHWWSNGALEMDVIDEAPPAAPQVRACTDG